jgi:hypothetical protein
MIRLLREEENSLIGLRNPNRFSISNRLCPIYSLYLSPSFSLLTLAMGGHLKIFDLYTYIRLTCDCLYPKIILKYIFWENLSPVN